MVTQTSHGKCDRNKEAVRLRDLYLPLRFEKNDNIILDGYINRNNIMLLELLYRLVSEKNLRPEDSYQSCSTDAVNFFSRYVLVPT